MPHNSHTRFPPNPGLSAALGSERSLPRYGERMRVCLPELGPWAPTDRAHPASMRPALLAASLGCGKDVQAEGLPHLPARPNLSFRASAQ